MGVVVARHGELLHHGVCYIGEPSYPDMLRNALRYDGPIDLVAPIPDLSTEIIRLIGTTPAKRVASSR